MMLIREELPADIPGIHVVEALAFGRSLEADLVDALRAHGKVTLSLVAEEDGQIIGHVLFSPGHIDGPQGATPLEGMGPVAVHPACQRRGIGSALIRAGLERLRAAGVALVIVEGSPRYYPRFGFQDAAPLGVTCEFNPPPGCFMLQALVPGALTGVSGVAHYAEEFQSVG
jgi:putative acetyltransferase